MTTDEIMNRLAAPFDESAVVWHAAAVSGNRALAKAELTAQAIRDRLNEVLGPTGWEDDYQIFEQGNVLCKLTVRVPGAKTTRKTAVGSPDDLRDGDKLKQAFGDAFRQAALKFRVGRHLERLPAQWCDWDPMRKRFVTLPRLPEAGGAAGRRR